MARHRNVRGMDFDEEYEGYYSVYGHSVEDDFCISPRTEAQFLYDRNNKGQSISAFLDAHPLTEEHESEDTPSHSRTCSLNEDYGNLTDTDFAKLRSCVEALQNVVGDTVSEGMLSKAATDHAFDMEKALDAILTGVYSKANTIAVDKTTAKESYTGCQEAFTNETDNILRSRVCNKVLDENKASNTKPIIDETLRKLNIRPEDDRKSKQVTVDCEKDNMENVSFQNDDLPSNKPIIPRKNVCEIYHKERGNEKSLLNLVVIGHVDAGKSTLMGHLLYKLGCVPKKAMHKYEQDSKKLGKASFMYAWVLDETSEERNRGITMDVAQSKFETPHRTVNLLDAPGHKDFIPNMITGAAQADVSILVVDATRGEFETGFETGGQTREHTMLIRSLGVSQLAVAVNKLDNVNWEKKRYEEIVSKLSGFLKQAGFKDSEVQFIPCSGLTGENLTKPPEAKELQQWYTGPNLIDVIDSFIPPERPVLKPFRMCVGDVFKGMGAGFCASGMIEAGFVQNGDKVIVMPAAEVAVVRSITIENSAVQHSFAGDHVIVQLTGIDVNSVTAGSIVCDINVPVKVATCFEARLVIFNITVPITKGFPVIFHYQSLNEQAVIKKLTSQLHRSTGELVKKNPRLLTKNSSAVVVLEVTRPICLELYKEFKDLGRFMLRSCGSTVAAGLVTKIF